ncbi:SRPBCC family protein [Rubrobacter indicoceani]|uniref:SRPBCC family protein n=1 Tax=Rubrobacter indicoceani TaxID=2051957 RepID=UPI000E5B06FC|nr:SRPBCC family protein [Rubrobacter indicoceani]
MSRVSVNVERFMAAPAREVAGYLLDFRNVREWMVGVEDVRRTSDNAYRLVVKTPIGRLEPAADVVESGLDRIRWVYTSAVEGDGEVDVSGSSSGCTVRYRGDFSVRGRILGRAAKTAGMENFAHRQGERSLERLKHLMEAGRYR